MRKLTALKALAAAGAMLAAGPAMAATPVVDGTGKLTGATGVTVGGSTYNVEFLDGTCGSVFTGCDAASDFTFQTQADALAAGNALVLQVLLGTYDTNPGLTNGCALNSDPCTTLVPYSVNGSVISVITVRNNIAGSNVTSAGTTDTSFDLTGFTGQTYARFTLAATSVPEPASWAMMLLGFAGIGLAARRRTRGWSPAA